MEKVAQNGGGICSGSLIESQMCNDQPCQTQGKYISMCREAIAVYIMKFAEAMNFLPCRLSRCDEWVHLRQDHYAGRVRNRGNGTESEGQKYHRRGYGR